MDALDNLIARREIITALLVAAENPGRLIAACASAEGDDLAGALIAAFGFTPEQADAVLAMQIRRLFPSQVAVLRAEHAEVTAEIAALRASHT